MSHNTNYLALDVGEKRIGVALGDSGVRIAVAYETINVDGGEISRITELVGSENIDVIVIGYPRNQSGEATAQTTFVEKFSQQLNDIGPRLVYQDESLTSVLSEQRLKSHGKPYTKADIDAMAAAIILQDYMERSV